ncbi:MAG: FtsB family cell division protein [Trebonia sp.]
MSPHEQAPPPSSQPNQAPSPQANPAPAKARARAQNPAQAAAHAAALAAIARQTRLTGRAAVLAVVICAIALSLAYPVREYIAQRQQIDQLLADQQTMSAQVKALAQEDQQLGQTQYIEQQAEDQLHMCFPSEQCYEVISGRPPAASSAKRQGPVNPWYDKLWQSVQRANSEPK